MKKLSLNQINETYEIILNPERIVGGNGCPITTSAIGSIFDLSGLNAGAQTTFITEIQMLSTTDVGSSMLHSLYNNALSTGGKIAISSATPEAGAIADYNIGTNTIAVGDLTGIDTTNNNVNAIIFGAISHELYHAYEALAGIKENGNVSSTEITVELDAYLFQGMAETELDASTGTNYYVHDIGKDIADSKTQSQPDFVNAWNSIMAGQGFSVTQYNDLINDMKSTWFDIYQNESTDNVTFLNSSVGINPIYNLYTNVYTASSYACPGWSYNSYSPTDIPPTTTPPPSGGTPTSGSGSYSGPGTSPPTGSYTPDQGGSSGGTTPSGGGTTPGDTTGGDTNNSGGEEYFYNPSTGAYEYIAPGSPEPGDGWVQQSYDPRSSY